MESTNALYLNCLALPWTESSQITMGGQDKLWEETILRMATQLLKAVKFIHSAGMCHGGECFLNSLFAGASYLLISDISGRNIAFSCTNLLNSPEEQLFEVLGSPEIEALVRLDGMPLENGLPRQLVKAAEWVDWIDEDDEDIRLLDFGESFIQGEEPEKLAQPGTLRVPETIFTNSFDYRIDLWRTGCMVSHRVFSEDRWLTCPFQIYSFLFTKYPFWYLGEDDMLVCQMISLVGRLPAEWESTWESMQARSSHSLEIEGKHTAT